jgi:hypothetical protein
MRTGLDAHELDGQTARAKPRCCGGGSHFISEGNHLLPDYARLCTKRHRYGVKPNKTDDFTLALKLQRTGCRIRL